MQEYIAIFHPKSKVSPLSASMFFGALCWTFRDLYGEDFLLDTITKFSEGDPPFVFSEPFPYFDSKNGGKILFLPRPIMPSREVFFEGREGAECLHLYRKYQRFRSISFVSETLFSNWAKGLRSEGKIFEELEFYDHRTGEMAETPYVGMGGFAMTKEEHSMIPHNILWKKRFGEAIKEPPITISKHSIGRVNRVNQKATPFCQSGLNFSQGGLYIFIRSNEEWGKRLDESFKFLGQRGIGRNRGLGWGKFQFSGITPSPLQSFSSNNHFITLSRFIPDAEDIKKITETTSSSYRLIPYHGYTEGVNRISRPKPTLYLFEAGSLFGVHLKGCCPTLLEEDGRKVLQYGMAYCISVSPQDEGKEAVKS